MGGISALLDSLSGVGQERRVTERDDIHCGKDEMVHALLGRFRVGGYFSGHMRHYILRINLIFLLLHYILFSAAAMTQCPEKIIIFMSLQHIKSSYQFLVQLQLDWPVQDAQERFLSGNPDPSKRHRTGRGRLFL